MTWKEGREGRERGGRREGRGPTSKARGGGEKEKGELAPKPKNQTSPMVCNLFNHFAKIRQYTYLVYKNPLN